MGGYANYLNSLQFNDGDVGAALLQQYMQMAQRSKPDEAASWSGIMSVAAACLPGPSTTTAEDGSVQQVAPAPVTRLIGMVPHLASRAMGVVWEQDPDGTDEVVGTQVRSASVKHVPIESIRFPYNLCSNQKRCRMPKLRRHPPRHM